MKDSEDEIPMRLPYPYLFFFVVWLFVWFINTLGIFLQEKGYYHFACRTNSYNLQWFGTIYDNHTKDYYPILKLCDRLLPEKEEMTIILPREPVHRFEFLRERGRYILYPRNYGNNNELKKYILVYGVKDYEKPHGYVIVENFAQDKYLLKRQD